jgi:hypothetical protein
MVKDPDIKELVRECYQSGSYKAVRCLGGPFHILFSFLTSLPEFFRITSVNRRHLYITFRRRLVRWWVQVATKSTLPTHWRSTAAVERSWNREFTGDAASALWKYITAHFGQDKSVYAHYAAIVQSSGMGKSRMVDQLAKCRFIIPINLRGPNSTGPVLSIMRANVQSLSCWIIPHGFLLPIAKYEFFSLLMAHRSTYTVGFAPS